ncbi:hypothetical protein F4861DRAFT_43275 [Xylaria intraflava]|nr:hypothetical protein F4861DRAFT_43275 [Xylaria intraflava]
MTETPEYRGAATALELVLCKKITKPQDALPPIRVERQPGPPTSGKFYHEDKRQILIQFIYCPDPSLRPETQDWEAVLFVKCSDVPRLMREGFHWNDENVVKEDGYIDKTPRQYHRATARYRGSYRHYFLTDLQKPPRWVATLQVLASKLEALSRFRLDELSRENTYSASAYSQSGPNQPAKDIYSYHHQSPASHINAIYDDRPLEGWWPWPRKDSTDTTVPPWK